MRLARCSSILPASVRRVLCYPNITCVLLAARLSSLPVWGVFCANQISHASCSLLVYPPCQCEACSVLHKYHMRLARCSSILPASVRHVLCYPNITCVLLAARLSSLPVWGVFCATQISHASCSLLVYPPCQCEACSVLPKYCFLAPLNTFPGSHWHKLPGYRRNSPKQHSTRRSQAGYHCLIEVGLGM